MARIQSRRGISVSRSLINLRVTPQDRRLIDRAAAAMGKSRSDFMLEAVRQAANKALLDKVLIRVDAKTHAAVIAHFDEPPAATLALRKLMQTRAPWET